MPTSYTTTVAVTGSTASTLGDQLDSLEIISGSTNPYELPQPPSARASFLGLPVVSGVTQTPDWWIGKEVTFTIAPQGATGTVDWTGIVQGYTCSPVQTSSSDQIVELDLLGATSRLSTEVMSGDINFGVGLNYWTNFDNVLTDQIAKTTWDEIPTGMTWDKAAGTWDTFTCNRSGLLFTMDAGAAAADQITTSTIPCNGQDMLSFITQTFANKKNGWFWFDNLTTTFNFPSSYTNYTQITSLNASTCLLWSSLTSAQNFSNIVNNASITDVTGVTSEAFLDSNSYNTYGNRYQDFGYSLEANSSDRLQVITNKVNAYKAANTYLQSFTVDLDELTHVAGEWQNFYKSTKPVRLPVTNIPAAYGGDHTYMVRGVQLNLTRKHAEATLLVVPSTIYNPS